MGKTLPKVVDENVGHTGAAQRSTLVHIADIGRPLSTTIAGSLGFAISCLQAGPPVNDMLYWTLYAIWALSTAFVILFTCYWVTPKKRIHYFLLFLVIMELFLALLVASSASALDEMSRHLKTWGPILTILSAGAPTFAFDKHNPEGDRTGQDAASGSGTEEGAPEAKRRGQHSTAGNNVGGHIRGIA
ncbi:hypothetical protein ACEPPN_005854 [Leptodophora sp. 'Broadleaf-Isolate-01']